MRGKKQAMAGLFAASAALLLGGAPIALAQDCDPQASVCQGVTDDSTPPSASPPAVSEDQYPFDDEWYFNPAGGGTILQPNHPSNGGEVGPGGNGGASGGGGHR